MKKIFTLLTFVAIILSTNITHADYPKVFGDNSEYVICGMHAGTGWYINRKSVNVLQYAPPIYRISCDVAVVRDAMNGSTKIVQVLHNEYRYDWNERKMYQLVNGAWRYIPPVGTTAELPSSYDGELAFFIAYRLKFYGELYADKNYNFNADLYGRLENAEQMEKRKHHEGL